MTPVKIKLLEYSIAISVGIAIVILYISLKGTFQAQTASEVYRNLSDGCLIAGGFAVGGAGLLWISNQGGFLGLRYGVEWTLSRFIHAMKAGTESYHDFRQRHLQSRKTPVAFLLFVGIGYLLLAVTFLILFYTVYVAPAAESGSELSSLVRML